MSTFGDNLRKIRKQRGLTLEELADGVNRNCGTSLTRSTISKWERGKMDPRASSLVAVARFLHVSVNALPEMRINKKYCINMTASALL